MLRILRWMGIAVAIAAGAAGLVLLSAYAILQSEAGRARVVELLNRHLSTPGVSEVRIGRLEGDLPGRIEIRDLTLGDGAGTWLRVDFAAATWRPADLLIGTLAVSKLEVDGLTVVRTPQSGESTREFDWPELPLRVSIERFSLARAVLEQAVLGAPVAFRASGDTAIEGPDRVTTTIAVTRTDGVSGHARLEMLLRPRSNFLGFQLALSEADGGVLAHAFDLDGLPSLSIKVDGEGPLDALRGTARARAGDLAFVESGFTIDFSARPVLDLDGRARIAGLVDAPIRDLLSGDITFGAQGAFTEDGIRLRHATLANDLATVELSGELSGLTAELDASVTVSDLVPLADIMGVPLQGRASAQTRIRADDIRQGAMASVDAILSEPIPSGNPLQAPLGSRVSVAGTFEIDAGRHWAVRDLTVTGDSLELTANAKVSTDASRLDGNYRLSVPKLAALTDIVKTPVAGKLGITGDIGGSLAHPTLSAHATSPTLSVDDVVVGAVDARLNLTQLTDGVSGAIDLSIDNGRIGAVSLASRFSGDPGDTIRLDGLAVQSRDAKLEGAMVINFADATMTGQLNGRELPLAAWSDLAGRALSGSASVVLDLRGGKAQQLDVSVSARRLNVVLGPQGSLAVDSVEASVRVEDPFGSPKGGMRALVMDARLADTHLASTVLEVKMRDPRRMNGRLQIRGDLHGPFELEAIADYDASGRGFVATVSELEASVGGQDIVLTKPARLEHDAGTTTLASSTFAVAEGRLTADGRVGVDRIEARLELDSISLAVLGRVASVRDVTGILSGHVRVSGLRNAPTGELDLKTDDVRSTHTTLAVASPISGRLRGDWRNDRLQLNARLAGIAESSVEARVSVPLRLEPESLALTMPTDGAIDGELRWSGELAPVWDLLSPYEDRFTGSGELALDLAGTMGSPQASGYFRVNGGRYENVHSGTTLTDVNLHLVGNGDKLDVEKLSASDGKQGTLAGGGIIDFLPAEDYPTNLRLDFNDMLLVARDDLILNASGNLALEGTFSNALLSGEIVTGNSELSLAGTLPPQVVELDVQEVNISDATQLREWASESSADPSIIILDLDISVPGRAFVRGLGLDSEWQGDVKISGDADAPNVAGVLHPVRGHFSLMGKRFRLERGDIRFTGADDVDPLLDLTAEHDAANLKAIVHVTGSASQPKVSLTSRPPLPESEIASQVLFGTGSGNLTTAQSLQLASAVATYSGKGGAIGILDATRRALGVDVIGFTESKENPDTTRVSVGKYVTEGVYLEVEASAEESSRTTTTVEVEVLPDVRIEGGTTEKGGNKVGVKWKWDY